MKLKYLGLAGFLGVMTLLLSTSSVCGCISAIASFGYELGVHEGGYIKSAPISSLEEIQQSLLKKFQGQQLSSLSPPKAGLRNVPCKQIGSLQLNCEHWFEYGMLRKKGILVSYFANSSGNVEKIAVSNVSDWQSYLKTK